MKIIPHFIGASIFMALALAAVRVVPDFLQVICLSEGRRQDAYGPFFVAKAFFKAHRGVG